MKNYSIIVLFSRNYPKVIILVESTLTFSQLEVTLCEIFFHFLKDSDNYLSLMVEYSILRQIQMLILPHPYAVFNSGVSYIPM